MNPIIFDVTYQKKTEIDSIKLSPESEFQQLKIMLCGKYKIFDPSKLYIYHKNALLIPTDDTQKLKEIFKSKKIKIEISNTPLAKFVRSTTPDTTSTPNIHLCKCNSNAVYLCEKCEEFICDFCLKQKKHITHNKDVIKLDEYSKYVKKTIKEMAGKLDEKIINDEAYKFLKYWSYDKEKEIKSIDDKYEFIKKLLEDIKQMEIDYLIFLNEGNDYDTLKQKIIETINLFSNFDINEQNVTIEEIIKQKKILVNISNDLFTRYNKIKFQLLNYTKNLKELQAFNEIFQKMIQEKFNFIKKKILLVNNNIQSMSILGRESILNNRYMTLNNDILNNTTSNNLDDKSNLNGNVSFNKDKSIKLILEEEKNKTTNGSNNNKLISVKLNTNTYKIKRTSNNNFSPKINRKNNNKYNSSSKVSGVIKIPELLEQKSTFQDKNKKLKNIFSFPKLDTSLNTSNKNSNLNIKGNTLYKSLQFSPQTRSLNNINNINIYSHNKSHEHLLFKLKNRLKILIFSYENQNFTEKNYVDKSNFKKELTSEKDIIQLNLNNKLYLLSGKKHNKLYCYEYQSNSIYFINNTNYSHYLGAFVYCPKNKILYLLGGNSQPGCEIYFPNNQSIISNFNSSTTTLNKYPQKKTFWKKIPDLNEERQEFTSMYFNDYIYVFFGFSHLRGKNLSSIERINVDQNDKFEVVYINEQITLSSLSCALYYPEFDHGWEKEGILLLGGFDGEKYVENSLVFTPDKMKIRECDVIIPNITKHFQFLFHQESNFIQLDINNSAQFIFDMKNNVHVLTKDSYELLSEVQ